MHIGARIARSRHAVQCADCLALNKDHTLVAGAHFRQITLGDNRLRSDCKNISISAPKFSSPDRWKMPAPPLPKTGFRIMSPNSARNAFSAAISRVMSVSGNNPAKRTGNIFSGALRTAAGSLTTSVPGCTRSSICVAEIYCMSKGGSCRIKMTSSSRKSVMLGAPSS